MKNAISAFALIFGLMFSMGSFAAATIESMAGQVRAGATATTAAAVKQGQQIKPGSVVVTGPKSNLVLRFDDGQAIVLNENTEFRVIQYAFSKAEPAKDRFVFELLKGALRSITAALTNRNTQAYALRTPVATIGIRGTDFMVHTGSLYISVGQGLVTASNGAGAATFAAGQVGFVANAAVLPASIAAAQLPAGVAASFSQLGAIPVAGAAAGAAGAAGAAAGGVAPAVAAGAAAAAAAAAAAGSDTPTGTTGTR